ncbi:hypothetical protein [Streptococcus pluranimalium]|uniref:hypothetical protein n=1 Tax=Streptococcus pluranimalium TaxID=82348 RepID=UPI0039FD7F64
MKKSFLIIIFCFLLIGCSKSNSNESAEKKEHKDRFVTVVNDTDQILKRIVVKIDKGTEIKEIDRPKKKSISIKIPREYEEHTNFTIEAEDRYHAIYKKEKVIKSKKGRYEIVIKEDDIVSEGNRISKFLNGD